MGVGTSTGSLTTRLALQSSSTNSEVFRVYNTSYRPILALAEDISGNGQFILRDSSGNTRAEIYGAPNGFMNLYDSTGGTDFSFFLEMIVISTQEHSLVLVQAYRAVRCMLSEERFCRGIRRVPMLRQQTFLLQILDL
jgi:hypothetical protein